MDRLEELKNWFNTAPIGAKFPMQIDGLAPGFAEVSIEVQMGDLVAAEGIMIVQGGIIAVIADGAAALAAMSVLPSGHTRLAQLNYDLVSPTTLLDFRLVAFAKVIAQDKKRIWVVATVYSTKLSPNGNNFKAIAFAKFAKPK